MEELSGKNSICNENGTINSKSVGWSRNIFDNCDIKSSFFRRKTWNHYMYIDKRFICAFALVNLDYAGVVFIDFYDLDNKEKIHHSIQIPLSLGFNIDPQINSYAHFKNKYICVNTIIVKDKLNIMVKFYNINIEATIDLEEESLNVLVPWNDKQFHYTSKQLPLKCIGYIDINNKIYNLDDSMAFIDYGRGIWPRVKNWYWLTCGFNYLDKRIGINLGGNWTNNTGVNENCIKIDNEIFKLYSDLEFEAMDMDNWTIKSVDSDEVNLVFTPINMYEKINNLFIVKSSLKQYIGKLNGTISIKGEKIEFKDVLSWCEDHYAKW